MSLRKSALIAFVIIPGCVTLFIALKSAGFAPGTGGFAVLSVDAAYSDRAIGEALSGAGIPGYISESNSWVFLDDFGELKRVALDLYDEMVEPFDPRNDGYAERLRSFFVKDGKRRFFIDLGALWRQPRPDAFRFGTKALPGAFPAYRQLEGRISAALGAPKGEETAFTLDGFPATLDRSGLWLLLLSLAASGGALFLALKNPGAFPRGFPRLTAALIPVQGALALSGPGGFACAAALFGCFECLLPPIRENLFRVQRRRRRFRFDRIFRINWLLALFFFLIYVLAAAASPVDPLTAVLAGISAFAAFGFLLWLESSESNPEGGHIHRRFLPIPIRTPSFNLNSLPRITLPFALASFFSLFLPLFGPSGRSQDIFPDVPAREEYEAHFTFQSSFSLRPLGSRDQTGDAAYLAYYLGEDGLIAGSFAGLREDSRETADPAAPDYPEIPPFPLEELSTFFENGGNYTARETGAGDIFAALVVLFLALPSCFRRVREKRKMGSFFILNDKGDKQAAA
ncbi:MAG: hypothetical protein LBF77_09635 [Spirochaetaceae bacterium]|jgi:hypothetical protein|nr:hypothetical protein [Spirochaetaceae bacterium]